MGERKETGKVPNLHGDNDGYWTVRDLTSFGIASPVIAFLTQLIQQKTGWDPIWLGFVFSVVFAALSVAFMPSQSWTEAIGNVIARTIQLYFSIGGAVGLIHKVLLIYGPKPEAIKAETKREFWKPWF